MRPTERQIGRKVKGHTDLPESRIELLVRGQDIFVYEFYSRHMTQEILKRVREDYGLEAVELCHSLCG